MPCNASNFQMRALHGNDPEGRAFMQFARLLLLTLWLFALRR